MKIPIDQSLFSDIELQGYRRSSIIEGYGWYHVDVLPSFLKPSL